jgi:hypothetical protein
MFNRKAKGAYTPAWTTRFDRTNRESQLDRDQEGFYHV